MISTREKRNVKQKIKGMGVKNKQALEKNKKK